MKTISGYDANCNHLDSESSKSCEPGPEDFVNCAEWTEMRQLALLPQTGLNKLSRQTDARGTELYWTDAKPVWTLNENTLQVSQVNASKARRVCELSRMNWTELSHLAPKLNRTNFLDKLVSRGQNCTEHFNFWRIYNFPQLDLLSHQHFCIWPHCGHFLHLFGLLSSLACA